MYPDKWNKIITIELTQLKYYNVTDIIDNNF